MNVDLAIIGGGAAGLAAALKAHQDDQKTIVIERERVLGGILNQCIHNGFGLHVFKEELTGPEYAERFIELFFERGIDYLLDTTVIDIKKSDDFSITITSDTGGIRTIRSKAVILSTGCYERTRGSVSLPGERPKGIMPAGSAQRYLNIDGYLVGERVFILGSGDIGLIMARRMTLEGATVLGVAELMPYSNGLTRNVVQCLHDYDIPLYLSHTVVDIEGKDALRAVTIRALDDKGRFIEGTDKRFEVDTLLLSIGLIPDVALFDSLSFTYSELTKSAVVNQFYESSVPGLFVCGNALHVHDLVDYVTVESERAGECAREYLEKESEEDRDEKEVILGDHIRYVIPQVIDFNRFDEPLELAFRTTARAEVGVFRIYQNDEIIKEKKTKFIAPAEMEKIAIRPDEIRNTDPITLTMEVIKP
ncbi:MAG: NAD(P)/FAD-dependent oxidoreductase [Acholeplasmataceae bacterium]